VLQFFQARAFGALRSSSTAGTSIVIVVVAFRVWARAFTRRRNAWLVGCVAAIFAVVLDFTLFLNYHRRYDEGIKLAWKVNRAFSAGEVERLSCRPDSPIRLTMESTRSWVTSPRQMEKL
jgi:hypothetical protein